MSIQRILRCGLLAAVLCVSALLRIPYFYGSITLQVAAVLLIGCMQKPLDAFSSVLTYLLLGFLGLPLFSTGGGMTYVLQPTFGYLLGFLLGAPLLSALYPRMGYWPSAALCVAVIYLFGALHMALVLHLTFWQALYTGCIVYLPADALKALGVWLILKRYAWQGWGMR